MNIRLKPETESRLKELASRSGRPADELVEDALAGYLAEAAELGDLLDSRSDDIKSGRVKALEGETFFEDLRQREEIRKRLESLEPVRRLRPSPAAAVRAERDRR